MKIGETRQASVLGPDQKHVTVWIYRQDRAEFIVTLTGWDGYTDQFKRISLTGALEVAGYTAMSWLLG